MIINVKTVQLNIFVESVKFFQVSLMSKNFNEQHLFEIQILCDIIYYFSFTFD